MLRKIFLLSLLMFSSLSARGKPTYMKLEDITPSTFEEICGMEKKMIEQMRQQMEEFLHLAQQKNFPAAFASWNDFYRNFIVAKIQLEMAGKIAKTAETKRKTKEAIATLEQVFVRLARDSKRVRKEFTLMGKEEATSLSPLQRDITYRLLSQYLVTTQQLAQKEAEEMLEALEALSPLPRHAYATYQSDLPAKTPPSTIKILNVNTLCFPEMLSCYFGGMRPWQERIGDIAQRILSTEAEILCLQEVWDFRAAERLMDELEEEYTYFYYDIGNSNYILDPTHLKVNSGLFVASKYPISKESFVPFEIPGQHPGLRRGIFFFVVGEGTEYPFGMINTHLESGNGMRQAAIRKQSLLVADRFFDRFLKKSEEEIPLFLTGDLNIDSTSAEYVSSKLEKNYANYFRIQGVDDPYTCTDFFEQLVFASTNQEENVRPNFAAFDYFVAKKKSSEKVRVESKKLTMFDWKKPMEALSDHHGLINQIEFLSENLTQK